MSCDLLGNKNRIDNSLHSRQPGYDRLRRSTLFPCADRTRQINDAVPRLNAYEIGQTQLRVFTELSLHSARNLYVAGALA